ncbi:transmembrane protease serine 2-like [Trichomycterus rosablanca]|uniref:transmembrane protease serine 2-like n=1 Tax=Trichomycterus rosablanca TaxID=2290929 RepID=UPI002F359087
MLNLFLYCFCFYSVSCQSDFAVTLNCIACGKREDPNPAVPEGEVVSSEGCWPWQVSLRYLKVHRCGGTIITPTWIVTSANCVHKLPGAVNWTVHAGVLNQIEMKNSPGINITKIVKHPDYDKVTHENDIALMKLNTLLIMSPSVSPVCLPNSGMDISAPRQAYISGWAPVSTNPTAPISTLLRQAKITIIDKSVCNGSTMLDGQISDSMVCAGDRTESFPCRGDTGSPLVTEMNSLWWLVGAFSWGDSNNGCPYPYQPGVYTNVTSYVDWIYEKILEK